MRQSLILSIALSVVAEMSSVSAESLSPELGTPFRVVSGNAPIDVDVGHAAPLVTDFDGDGNPDLLVGQFGDGQLRIYRNASSKSQGPVFERFVWFKAGGVNGKVPAG